jgi:hypothetical protein
MIRESNSLLELPFRLGSFDFNSRSLSTADETVETTTPTYFDLKLRFVARAVALRLFSIQC